MATYRDADNDCLALIKELVEKHHHELHEAGVRIGAALAFAPRDKDSGEPKGPALKKDGRAVPGDVWIVPQKLRVKGLPDAVIYLDGDAWEGEWSDERKRAVLDHYITRLEVMRDKDGAILLDDCCRPRLRKRSYDWSISGFASVAQRHKESSYDMQNAREMAQSFGQLLFPY